MSQPNDLGEVLDASTRTNSFEGLRQALMQNTAPMAGVSPSDAPSTPDLTQAMSQLHQLQVEAERQRLQNNSSALSDSPLVPQTWTGGFLAPYSMPPQPVAQQPMSLNNMAVHALGPQPMNSPGIPSQPVAQQHISPYSMAVHALGQQPMISLSIPPQPVAQQPISPYNMAVHALGPQPVTSPRIPPQSIGQQPIASFPMASPPFSQKPITSPSMPPLPLGQQPISPYSMAVYALGQQPMTSPSIPPQPVAQQPISPQNMALHALGQQPMSSPRMPTLPVGQHPTSSHSMVSRTRPQQGMASVTPLNNNGVGSGYLGIPFNSAQWTMPGQGLSTATWQPPAPVRGPGKKGTGKGKMPISKSQSSVFPAKTAHAS
eukprot:gene8100-1346_t